MNYHEVLMERMTKMRDQMQQFAPASAAKYTAWLAEIKVEQVTSPEALNWLLNHADYEREKDRAYAKYIYQLCGHPER